MSHRILAFIGSAAQLTALAAILKLPEPRSLSPDLKALPVEEDFGCAHFDDGEWAPPTAVLQLLAQHSRTAPMAFVETDYFGGTGGQGAVVFGNGIAIYGPEWDSIGPINRALALLGVEVTPPMTDEFDATGLGSIRTFEP